MVAIPSTPEIYEEDFFGVVDSRTESLPSLRDLGPPDLIHLTRVPVKGAQKQQGIYHHVTGVDASSSASLAAYLNTLTHTPHDKINKVVSGVYSCYNAFSRLDMRVQIQIPGTLEAYCIDERGDKRDVTDDLWLETYLCAVLRAYSYSDDGSGESIKKIVGVRRFNPVTNTDAEHKFLEASERLFFNGWQLGSDPEVQVPNLVSNHLTTGLLKYFRTTGRYTQGINLFEKLRARDPEISSLLARVYIYADEEVKAIQLLHEAISELPMDYALLDCQAEFLDNKGASELALEVSKRAVVAAPSEFSTWARLASVYVSLEQWDKALLTLNSCPMFTYTDKDAPRVPDPLRVYLPTMPESLCDEIEDRAATELEHVNLTLRKLHAGNFKGTFLKAYMLLTEITTKIGWDQLLKIRSQVFVMEEEYKTEKQNLSQTLHSRNPSTTALRSPSPERDGQTNGNVAEDSRESGEHTEDDDEPDKANGDAKHPAPPAKTDLLSPHRSPRVPLKQANDADSDAQVNSLQNKRLCERWLDNLFMVLYEDLRVYTIWRTEMAQCRQQGVPYRKSAEEFEILGELAERLHHPDEAVEAYQGCLAQRFSPKALRGVINWYEAKGDNRNVVAGVIRLICWQYRWYSEFAPQLLYNVRKLIEEEGAVKFRSMVQATSLPQHVRDLTHQYAALCAAFQASGTIDD